MKAIAAAYDAKARGERHYLGPQRPAETLRQLGLPAPGEASPRPRRRRRRRRDRSDPRAPEPAVVRRRASETASRTSEVSTSEFGVIGEEVSSVEALPDELRAARDAGRRARSGPGAGKLVLVVDDEEEIRKLVNRLLTDKGYRVIEADRGLLALRLVKEHLPDLIILDAMLPELHGFDIARRIKGSAKYGRIPIIMMSAVYRGWRIAEDLKQNYGIEEYIEKPFRIAEPARGRHASAAAQATRPSSQSRDPEYLSAEAEKALRDGIVAYKSGHIDEAIEHLKRGVGIDPLAYRLHFHLALIYGKKGQVYEGIQELERAIDLQPEALRRAEEPRRPLREGRLQEQGGRDVGAVRIPRARRADARVHQGASAAADLIAHAPRSRSAAIPC